MVGAWSEQATVWVHPALVLELGADAAGDQQATKASRLGKQGEGRRERMHAACPRVRLWGIAAPGPAPAARPRLARPSPSPPFSPQHRSPVALDLQHALLVAARFRHALAHQAHLPALRVGGWEREAMRCRTAELTGGRERRPARTQLASAGNCWRRSWRHRSGLPDLLRKAVDVAAAHLCVCILLVHADEVCRPQRRLLAARARAHLQGGGRQARKPVGAVGKGAMGHSSARGSGTALGTPASHGALPAGNERSVLPARPPMRGHSPAQFHVRTTPASHSCRPAQPHSSL